MNTTTSTLEMGQAATTQNLDRTMSGLKEGVAHATASMEQAQSAMRANVEKAIKSATDMFSFAQGNFEALTRSGQILATGMQDMAQSIKEAMDLQAALVRSTLEKAVTQTSKLTDSSMKLSEQALAPIHARLAQATETFGRPS